MIRKSLIAIAALVVVLVAVALGGFLYLRTSLPQTSGTVSLAGIREAVEIVRDRNAVPHIFAENTQDAYFALGFVHAQDRLWQMEFMRRLGASRLAEVLGAATADTDRFIRTLDLYALAEESAEGLSPAARDAFEAYAAGVNAWLEGRGGALPLEFVLLGFEPEPWRIADSLVWNRLMALRLGRNRHIELVRARIAEALAEHGLASERLAELWPDADPDSPVTVELSSAGVHAALAEVWRALPTGLTGGASNAWVVHGCLTDTGKPILANDPHLAFESPGLWYLARIEAPGLSLTGATVPGVPLTLLGHNGAIAWGFTNAGGDVEDLFVETVDPTDPARYLTPDGPRRFDTRREVIRVKDAEDLEFAVRETRHGPVVSEVWKDAASLAVAGSVIALATPALHDDDRTADVLLAINRAREWADVIAAVENFHTPHQNLTFAATDGDIGLVSPGRIPIRNSGDGRLPAPGADGSHDWRGLIPAPALPRTHNPESGRIVNANNRIVGDDYPHMITGDWGLPFRARRIVEVLDGLETHTLATSQALQQDIVSPAARRLVPLMLAREPADARGRRAVELLAKWDFAMRRDRPEPLIYAAWLRHLVGALVADEIGEELVEGYFGLVNSPAPRLVEAVLTRDRHWCDDVATPAAEPCEDRLAVALDAALAEVAADLGSDLDDWRWRALHRATFTHRVLTRVPLIALLADLSIGSDGGDHTVNRGALPRKPSPNAYCARESPGEEDEMI